MHRQTWSVAIVALLSAFTGAFGQSRGADLSPDYNPGVLAADLRLIDCTVPPDVFVAAYRDYVLEWFRVRKDSRREFEHAMSFGLGRLHGEEATKRAIRALERDREREIGAEIRLLEAIAAAAPECAEGIGRVRDWRRTLHEMPRNADVLQCFDVGWQARLESPADARRPLLDALAASEPKRRGAFERLQKSLHDGEIAAARIVDAAGAVGLDAFGPEASKIDALRQRYFALHPTQASVADVMETQLSAYRAIESLLTAGQRRMFIDSYLAHFGVLLGGPDEGLPQLGVHLQSPADVGRLVLSWRDLPAAKRKATRDALTAWIKDSDAAIVARIENEIARLRQGATFEELQRPSKSSPWQELSKKHIPLVVAASGATWLEEGNGVAPPVDSRDYEDEDLVVTGQKMAMKARQAEDTGRRRTEQLLPAPIEDATKKKLLTALELSDEQRLVVEELLAQHATEWASAVEPFVLTARTSQDAANRPDREWTKDLSGAIEQAHAADTARRAAFDAARRLDDELFNGMSAVLDEAHQSSVQRIRALREIGGVLDRLGNSFTSVKSVDLEAYGGAVFDFAAPADDLRVTPEVRRAAESAVPDRWAPMLALARETRELQLEAMLATRLAQYERSRSPNEDPQMKADADALRERESVLVDRWRIEGDAVMALMLDTVAKAGLDGGELRFAFEKRRFYFGYNRAASMRTLIDRFRALPAFDGKDALDAKLVALQEPIEALARESVASCMPLRSLKGVDEMDGMHEGMLQALIRSDSLSVSGSLYSLAAYLLSNGVPKDVLEKDPWFARMMRGYGY